MKVLFIGGTGRTGSTLLDRLLGSAPGWFSGGELAYLWRLGLHHQGLCACGTPVAECPVWSEALRRVQRDHPLDPQRMMALRKRFWSIHLPFMISRRFTERRFEQLEEYPQIVEDFYTAVADVTDSRVLIDSSKETHYSVILRERTDLDVYYLHLVRDPRAVGYSWTKRRPELGFDGKREMERRGVLKSSLYFNVSNLAANTFWSRRPDRYRLMRYEDFVADPAGMSEQIAEFLGEDLDLGGVLEGRQFSAGTQHTSWGNPNRFESITTIESDDEWREVQSPFRSHALGVINFPVAIRYGYRMNGRPRPIGGRLGPHTLSPMSPDPG